MTPFNPEALPLPLPLKRCPKCRTEKSLIEFRTQYGRGHGKARGRDRLRSWCRKCSDETVTQWWRDHPEETKAIFRRNREKHKRRISESYFKKTYGLDFEGWARLYESQWGLCGGCFGRLATNWSRRNIPHVDHDHHTGKVRGLLCSGCNLALGAVKDSPLTLRRLADYLELQYPPDSLYWSDQGPYDEKDCGESL